MKKRLVIAALVAVFAAGFLSFFSPVEAKPIVPKCTTYGVCLLPTDWYTICCVYWVPVDPDCRGAKCEMMKVVQCEDIPCS